MFPLNINKAVNSFALGMALTAINYYQPHLKIWEIIKSSFTQSNNTDSKDSKTGIWIPFTLLIAVTQIPRLYFYATNHTPELLTCATALALLNYNKTIINHNQTSVGLSVLASSTIIYLASKVGDAYRQ